MKKPSLDKSNESRFDRQLRNLRELYNTHRKAYR